MVQIRYEKLWRSVALLLSVCLLVPPAWAGQDGQLGAAPAQGAGLRLVVVEGDEARNVIQQIPPEPFAVRVEDGAGRPVAGAVVVFTAPAAGPSGTFADGSTTLTTMTGADGLAVARDYHPNALEGAYRVQVRAEFEGQTATAVIRQANIAPGGGGNGKLIAVLAIVGAAVGAIFATRSGGDDTDGNPTTPPPTISFGDGAVGAP